MKQILLLLVFLSIISHAQEKAPKMGCILSQKGEVTFNWSEYTDEKYALEGSSKTVKYTAIKKEGSNFKEILVGSTIQADFKGEKLLIAGSLDISLFDFVALEGDFAFEKATREVTLSDETSVKVNSLILAANDVNAFAGFNIHDLEKRVGFELVDFDFAFAIMTEIGETKRQWTTIQASAQSLGLVGLNGLEIKFTMPAFLHLVSASFE